MELEKYMFKSSVTLMDFLVATAAGLFGTYLASPFIVLVALLAYIWALGEQAFNLHRLHLIKNEITENGKNQRYTDIKIIYGLELLVFAEFLVLDV